MAGPSSPPPPPSPPLPSLECALEAAWFGGNEARPGRVEDPTGLQPRAAHGWLSWLFRSGDGDGGTPAGGRVGERRASRRVAGTPAAARSRAAGAEGVPRLPRPASSSKLQAAKGGGLPARAKPAAAAPAPTSDGTAAAAPAAADDAAAKRGGAAAAAGGGGAAPSRPSLKGSTSRAGLLKQANYAERRQAWRQRIEAIKAKQASRATAAAGDAPPGAAAGNAAGSGSRVFSKHVAIPLTAGGARGGGIAGGSTHGTPYGSPSRRELLHEAATLPQLEAPPVWQGFQTAEVPSDLGAASEEQLRRFLQQAGWAAEAAAALPDHESLVAAAHAARGAWSVERIMACTWPEEVLRVPRKCADVAVLRAAYRRCSMAVHPDKCTAQGASDAFAILGDCYNVLLAAASGGKAPAAVPAFMRAAAPSRAGAVHGSSSGSNLAAASAAAGPGGGTLPPGAGQRRQTTGHPAGAARQPSLDAELEQGGMRHSRHASVESFFAASDVHVWTEQQQQADQARQQQQAGEADQQPSRASSIGGEAGLPRDASASSHEHWNPHAHFSSEDAEGGAYAVVPPPAPRSRSSSTSSFAAAVAAGAPRPGSRGSSLGGSLGGGALQAAVEDEQQLPRQDSGGSLGGVPPSPTPPSPELSNGSAGETGQGSPGVAASSGPASSNGSRRGSPHEPLGTGSTPSSRPPSRPGSAAGAAPASASTGATRRPSAAALPAGGSKIRIKLTVKPKA